ncbi:hypothetical protein NLI96_g11089 [Meripilus lineatus]|uniref:Uncharacterized protein n=1 Tax=Meripilus lineatus TaxID=2056292 RepID=A0AAD5USI4_9APHY|nr:hypothetical protein NLI96_g11089 [Physisporinus lineatus]
MIRSPHRSPPASRPSAARHPPLNSRSFAQLPSSSILTRPAVLSASFTSKGESDRVTGPTSLASFPPSSLSLRACLPLSRPRTWRFKWAGGGILKRFKRFKAFKTFKIPKSSIPEDRRAWRFKWDGGGTFKTFTQDIQDLNASGIRWLVQVQVAGTLVEVEDAVRKEEMGVISVPRRIVYTNPLRTSIETWRKVEAEELRQSSLNTSAPPWCIHTRQRVLSPWHIYTPTFSQSITTQSARQLSPLSPPSAARHPPQTLDRSPELRYKFTDDTVASNKTRGTVVGSSRHFKTIKTSTPQYLNTSGIRWTVQVQVAGTLVEVENAARDWEMGIISIPSDDSTSTPIVTSLSIFCRSASTSNSRSFTRTSIQVHRRHSHVQQNTVIALALTLLTSLASLPPSPPLLFAPAFHSQDHRAWRFKWDGGGVFKIFKTFKISKLSIPEDHRSWGFKWDGGGILKTFIQDIQDLNISTLQHLRDSMVAEDVHRSLLFAGGWQGEIFFLIPKYFIVATYHSQILSTSIPNILPAVIHSPQLMTIRSPRRSSPLPRPSAARQPTQTLDRPPKLRYKFVEKTSAFNNTRAWRFKWAGGGVFKIFNTFKTFKILPEDHRAWRFKWDGGGIPHFIQDIQLPNTSIPLELDGSVEVQVAGTLVEAEDAVRKGEMGIISFQGAFLCPEGGWGTEWVYVYA